GWRRRRVLPAARRPGGLRAAAGSSGHDARPAVHVAACGSGRGHDGGGGGHRVRGGGAGRQTMSGSDVTRQGLQGKRPGREAMTGVNIPRRWRGKHRAEQPTVPPAEFTSYYGKPILNPPVWRSPDIPGYLFLGG